uniref:Cytochrome P450 n=1 Tax=Ditylenchus dipsaci TaxID=166011 RepID=A0A915EP10_9BILA
MIETVTQDLDKNNMCLDSYHLSPLLDVGVGSMINQLIFGFRFIGERRQQFFKLKELMNEQIQLIDGDSPLNEEDTYFVEAFLHEMEQNDLDNSKENNQIFKLPALRGMCGDLFFAGQETTSNTLKFIFLYMIVFPEVQTKMQEELDKEIGDNEEGTKRVTLADRAKLPYTNAVINESQRFCNLLPINLAHKTTKDVEIGGFKIAKGTVIVPNISNVLYDDKV